MDTDEQLIAAYLKSWRGQFVSGREICRRAASKKRYQKNPSWAVPVLTRLVEKGILESDATGHYRLRPEDERRKRTKWISPQIQRILERSAKNFSGTIEIPEPEDSQDDQGAG
jgi:hypothetical protein